MHPFHVKHSNHPYMGNFQWPAIIHWDRHVTSDARGGSTSGDPAIENVAVTGLESILNALVFISE